MPFTLCLFEDAAVRHLAPLALTRAASDLRVGAWTLQERAVRVLAGGGPAPRVVIHARSEVAGVTAEEHADATVGPLPPGGALLVNARWRLRPGALADALREAATAGGPGRAWRQGETLLAAWVPRPHPAILHDDAIELPRGTETIAVEGETLISRLWHLADSVGARVAEDVEAMGGLAVHAGADVQAGAILAHPERIHLAPGATVRPGAVLNAEAGPIRLETGATVEENAVVRGPVWLGPGASVKAAGRIDASAVGERSKVGGEVHASVVHSFSNKGHDGYLGNSYLGRWVNLGADTNTSNLKNDYGHVSLWDAVAGAFVDTERQFLGLFIGDHSKCAINTAFNTGTVVGVACNLFGAGFLPRHVPSFTWGGADKRVEYRPAKALRVAETVMARRGLPLSDANQEMLRAVHAATADAREADHPRHR